MEHRSCRNAGFRTAQGDLSVMTKLSHIAATAALGAALTACAAGGIIVQPPNIGSYDPEMLGYAASRGALLTQVLGNPFGLPRQEVEAAVIDSMAGGRVGSRVRFSTRVSAAQASPYRVVVLFNPAPGVQAARLCADSAQPTAQPTAQPAAQPAAQPTAQPTGGVSDKLRAMAAFCSNDVVVTSVAGSAAGVLGPNDPAFRSLIRGMVGELFPRRDPDLDSDSDWPV